MIEMDHPATHRSKKEALSQLEIFLENLFLLPVDFSVDSLEEKLTGASFFQPNKKTVYILEGVLMCLGQEDIEKLFCSLKSMSDNFRLVFTFLRLDGEGRYSHGRLFRHVS